MEESLSNSDDALAIEFDETLADTEAMREYVLALPFYQRQFNAGLKKCRSSTMWYIFVCGLAMMGALGLLLDGPRIPTHLFGFACGILIGIFSYGKRFSRHWYETYVRAYNLRQQRNEEHTWPRRVSVEIRPAGARLAWLDYELRVGWKHIWLVDHTATHALIVITSGQGVAIPLAAFPDSSSAQSFVRTAHKFMQLCGETQPQRLARYLETSDLFCPSCKYPLRGVVSEKCPECGRTLDLLELREIAQHASAARGRTRRRV